MCIMVNVKNVKNLQEMQDMQNIQNMQSQTAQLWSQASLSDPAQPRISQTIAWAGARSLAKLAAYPCELQLEAVERGALHGL